MKMEDRGREVVFTFTYAEAEFLQNLIDCFSQYTMNKFDKKKLNDFGDKIDEYLNT